MFITPQTKATAYSHSSSPSQVNGRQHELSNPKDIFFGQKQSEGHLNRRKFNWGLWGTVATLGSIPVALAWLANAAYRTNTYPSGALLNLGRDGEALTRVNYFLIRDEHAKTFQIASYGADIWTLGLSSDNLTTPASTDPLNRVTVVRDFDEGFHPYAKDGYARTDKFAGRLFSIVDPKQRRIYTDWQLKKVGNDFGGFVIGFDIQGHPLGQVPYKSLSADVQRNIQAIEEGQEPPDLWYKVPLGGAPE